MRRSQRVRLSDVRAVFRVLGDARDLRHDRDQQEVMIVDAMAELLGASFGHVMQFGEFRPAAPTHIQRLVPGSSQDSRVIHYVSEWGKSSDFNDDPMKHRWPVGHAAAAPRRARLARQLMTGRDQRQIADSLNLSYETVRSYAKELYDTVGASSREVLTALIRNQSN